MSTQTGSNRETAPFTPTFFPLHVALLSVGENIMPIGYWTVISKNPFRFFISMGVGNHSLLLLKKYKEAALHFMPWSERHKVARAGYLSGRDVNKAQELGFTLIPAEKLQQTKLVAGADSTFETVVYRELMHLSREFSPFVLDVVAVHGDLTPFEREPIIFLSEDHFATLGERWEYKR
jgi:flavin reductase (DIM6/NTAB) family NADH-FMN oxidoreductase RutF